MLVKDSLHLYRNGKSDYTRTLSFAYDDGGRLKHRELRQGKLLLEQQRWSYDAKGHITKFDNTFMSREAMRKLQKWESGDRKEPLEPMSLDDGLQITLHWSADGHLQKESLAWKRPSSEGQFHERRYSHSREGRTQTVTYGDAKQSHKEHITYDQRDNILRREYDQGNDGTFENITRHTYNTHGLLTLTRTTNRGGTSETVYRYICR